MITVSVKIMKNENVLGLNFMRTRQIFFLISSMEILILFLKGLKIQAFQRAVKGFVGRVEIGNKNQEQESSACLDARIHGVCKDWIET